LMPFILAIAFFFPGTGSSEPGRREVRVWTFNSWNMEHMQDLESELEARFAIDLTFELVEMEGFVPRLTEAVARGRGAPDIIEWHYENNTILSADPEYALVYPLENYIRGSKVAAEVPSGKLSWVTYGGHIYGLPDYVHPVVLIYNDTLWKRAGVNLEKVKTWDEFFAAAKKLTAEKKDGKPLHYALPSMDTGLSDTMYMIWRQSGADLLDAAGHPVVDGPAFKSFLDTWLEWRKSGAFGPWDWGNFDRLLADGTIAAYPAPDWWVSRVDPAAEEGTYTFKARPLPAYRPGGATASDWGGSFLAVPRSAQDPEFLFQVMTALRYDREQLIQRYTEDGVIPAWRDAWRDEVFHRPDPRLGGQRLGELQTAAASNLPPVVTGDLFWDAVKTFNQQYTEIIAGNVDARQGLADAQAAVLERGRLPRRPPEVKQSSATFRDERSPSRSRGHGGDRIVLWAFSGNAFEKWRAHEKNIEDRFGIDFQIELVPQEIFVEHLREAMRNGSAPDIIEWFNENTQMLSADPEKCLLHPLDELKRDWAALHDVPPGKLSWLTYGGRLYGVPVDVNPTVLIYNDTLWREAGVDMER
ncbi:MAG TPA: extracellular solute-binding protein, partial [Spirochaetia bacterium]|nr:extracellular solute-binding protein [Spirochaetia bacterium]